MAENQTVCLNRGLSLNFDCLRSVNHIKCTEGTEKHVLIKKYSQMSKRCTKSMQQKEDIH